MNTETGEIYRNLTPEQLAALQHQDPRIVEVSKEVADLVEAGRDALTLDLSTVERARISWHKKQERNGE